MAKFNADGRSKIVVDFVERLIKSGKRWTDDPFDQVGRGRRLKPNSVYESGKKGSPNRYIYTTDSQGRLSSAHARPLRLDHTPRGPHSRNTPGKREGDHAGHLIADVFGGSGQLDNLVSQASDVNLSQMKKLENSWKQAIENGDEVHVDIEVLYRGDSTRPAKFRVITIINGEEPQQVFIKNH